MPIGLGKQATSGAYEPRCDEPATCIGDKSDGRETPARKRVDDRVNMVVIFYQGREGGIHLTRHRGTSRNEIIAVFYGLFKLCLHQYQTLVRQHSCSCKYW